MTIITCPIGKCTYNVGYTCTKEKLELSKSPWIIVTGMTEYEARCRPHYDSPKQTIRDETDER